MDLCRIRGHDMLVLHPKAGGIISMANLDARRQINLRDEYSLLWRRGRNGSRCPCEHSAFKLLMPADYGPAASSSKRAHAAWPARGGIRAYEVVRTVALSGGEGNGSTGSATFAARSGDRW